MDEPAAFFHAIHPAGFYAPLSRTGWAASNPEELDADAPIGAKPLLYPFSYIQKTFDSGQPVSGTYDLLAQGPIPIEHQVVALDASFLSSGIDRVNSHFFAAPTGDFNKSCFRVRKALRQRSVLTSYPKKYYVPDGPREIGHACIGLMMILNQRQRNQFYGFRHRLISYIRCSSPYFGFPF